LKGALCQQARCQENQSECVAHRRPA
jgi:hypothetical protein